MNKHYRDTLGFTIIEIIIAITVIGILAGIVIVSGSDYLKRSDITTTKTKLTTAAAAMKKGFSENGVYDCSDIPPDIEGDLECDYTEDAFNVYAEKDGITYFVTQSNVTAREGSPPPLPGSPSGLTLAISPSNFDFSGDNAGALVNASLQVEGGVPPYKYSLNTTDGSVAIGLYSGIEDYFTVKKAAWPNDFYVVFPPLVSEDQVVLYDLAQMCSYDSQEVPLEVGVTDSGSKTASAAITLKCTN